MIPVELTLLELNILWYTWAPPGGSFASSDPPFKIRQALSYSRFLSLLQAQAYASAKFQDCNSCVQPQRGVFARTRSMINHFALNELCLDRVRCYTVTAHWLQCGWLFACAAAAASCAQS